MKIKILFLLISVLTHFFARSQVTPNSKRFEVKNYIAMDNNGQYSPYFTHGFAENVGNGSSAKIFLMPVLEIDLNNVSFVDSQGFETSSSNSDIYAIEIPVKAVLSLPNESQKAAIGAALNGGTNLSFYYPPILKNTFGGPMISPQAGVYSAQIMALANQYEQELKKQQDHIDAYSKFDPELVSLREYEIVVKVGNRVVYDERFPGTLISLGNTLDKISIDQPSVFVKNRIAGGNFSVLVKYKFRDSKNSYINARINARVVIDQFLTEAQRSVVNQSSKGWSFLGFGNRRKSLKSKFDEQVDQQYTDQRFSNTTIEMFDADDSMISLFEDSFFPSISKQKAIENHIAAADLAQQSGNEQLAQLHFNYASSLQNNDPNLEVNIGAAAAALAKKDYVGFIANGVRWGDYKASGNNSFRRVLNSNEMIQMETQWSQTKSISVNHSVTQRVDMADDIKLRPTLGFVNGIPFQGNLMMANGNWNQWENVRGLIIGPVTVGGTLHQNNIIAGNLLTEIGYNEIYDGQSLNNAMSNYSPGETVSLTIVQQVAQNVFSKKRISVELGSYPMSD